jgi:Ca2+-binding RTX toxin-like protein
MASIQQSNTLGYRFPVETIPENLSPNTLLGYLDFGGNVTDYNSVSINEIIFFVDEWGEEQEFEQPATHFHLVENAVYTSEPFDFERMSGNHVPNNTIGISIYYTDRYGTSAYFRDILKVTDVDEIRKGTDGNDRMIGGAGVDQFEGGKGDDVMKGGVDNDQLKGQDGKDTILGEAGHDILDGGSGNDELHGGDGDDKLVGDTGNDRLRGDNGADDILGGAGDDVLYGGAGRIEDGRNGFELIRNNLIGGLGRDKLVDQGADNFIFETVQDSKRYAEDTILNWTGKSIIDLHQIDANTKQTGNQDFNWRGAQGFDGKAGELRYVKMAHETYLYGDINGDKFADFSIRFDKSISLNIDDLIL